MSARIRLLALVILAMLALRSGPPAEAQAPAPAKPEAAPAATSPAPTSKPEAAPAPKPTVIPAKRFVSAEDATEALVTALRAGDTKTVVGVLGSSARTLISSGDAVSDRQTREKFLQAYDAAHRLIPYGSRTVLEVGSDNWPFPIPIVKTRDERWYFDTRQGRDEILARRIGRNELFTMQTCLAYVDAQREYYAEDRNGDGVLQYARQFASTPGKRDGLYWPTGPGEPPSPLGDLVVRARAEGYRRDASGGPTAFHGYLYRILTAQGPAAPDGAYDYIVAGRMIGGFALVAFPAQYGASGVMTFIVNHDGVVHEKDLGPKTRDLARAMKKFDPDSTWKKAEVVEVAATED
ncbi:MAG TPA: DUF2950 domain-containing protein [Methylomirabilota bacterium]|jgi:hypothetical protein